MVDIDSFKRGVDVRLFRKAWRSFRLFDNSICPDESLFQSLFMKTPYTNTRENIKVYLDWTGENRHPKTLTINDYDTLMNSDFLIARKFDEKIDGEIINKLESKLKMK